MDGFIPLQFPSATGTGTIRARLYRPADMAAPSGLCVQIVHGMAEHMQRYDLFCRYLSDHGHAVCIQDLPGHGQSAQSVEYLGYFGASDGTRLVLQDIDRLAGMALEQLRQGDRIPGRVLLGHSMGSFISRLYCTNPGQPLDAAIFSGTSGSNPATALGVFLAQRSVKRKGPLYKDEFLSRLSASGNLKRIDEPATPFDWLSRDRAIVEAYVADPWCGYTFTAAGYRDLFSWLAAVSKKDWSDKIKPGLQILLISGSEDPIGQYGKGPRQVYDRLLAAGHAVSLKVYDGARHEVLNEINRQDIWADIESWLTKLQNSKEKNGAES